jgi:type VII secretion protein EccB
VQTRRDQLQAYRFLTRRALAALVNGEPNAVEPPMRRLSLTTISGIMIAVLITAGFLLLGFIKPSAGDKWKAAGTIIVERETGARYVMLHGLLRPVLNYSSAVLAVGSQGSAKVVLVDRSDLKNTKRGGTIGIDGIPDSLPSSNSLVRSPVSVCSRQKAAEPTGLLAQVSVFVGSDPGSTAVPADAGVLATLAGTPQQFLVWHGLRLAIGSSEVAQILALQNQSSVSVGTAFLDSLPEGPNLKTPTIPQLGHLLDNGAGQMLRVGQLLTDSNGDAWVMLRDGVERVSPVQAQLLQTLRGADGKTIKPISTTPGDVLNMNPSSAGWAEIKNQFDGLPDKVPAIDEAPHTNGALCAVYRDGTKTPTLSVPPSLLQDTSDTSVTDSAESKLTRADDVQLASGRAAVVKANDSSTTVFVIASPGSKYPAASVGALAGFGYGNVTPVKIPSQVLGLIPTGPALDPDAARSSPAN